MHATSVKTLYSSSATFFISFSCTLCTCRKIAVSFCLSFSSKLILNFPLSSFQWPHEVASCISWLSRCPTWTLCTRPLWDSSWACLTFPWHALKSRQFPLSESRTSLSILRLKCFDTRPVVCTRNTSFCLLFCSLWRLTCWRRRFAMKNFKFLSKVSWFT